MLIPPMVKEQMDFLSKLIDISFQIPDGSDTFVFIMCHVFWDYSAQPQISYHLRTHGFDKSADRS